MFRVAIGPRRRIRIFTQEDPIGLAGGLNLYGFAGGDPVNFSDPFGLCPPEDPTRTDDCEVRLSGATVSNPDLMSALSRFAQDVVGQHVELNGPHSGDRDSGSNADVSGATASPHLTNEGADIHVAGMSNLQVAHAAANSGLFTGVGYYEGGMKWGPHAHVDIKGRVRPLTTWTADKNDRVTPGLPPLPCEGESCEDK